MLQKWGPGCHFLGHGLDSDIDALELILQEEEEELKQQQQQKCHPKRPHLQNVTDARKMLDEDVHARQRHLEVLVYNLAIEQLEYHANRLT